MIAVRLTGRDEAAAAEIGLRRDLELIRLLSQEFDAELGRLDALVDDAARQLDALLDVHAAEREGARMHALALIAGDVDPVSPLTGGSAAPSPTPAAASPARRGREGAIGASVPAAGRRRA